MEPSSFEPGAIVPLAVAVPPGSAFVSVAGEAALARVVRALLGPGRVLASRIVVVAADPLVDGVRTCLDAAGLSAVSVLGAGAAASRHACLAAGLDLLGREPYSSSHVLVGDHRHPLASAEVTDRVIAGLRAGHRVVVPVLPLTDTVKAVDDRGAVEGTVDRTALRSVQYPRGYQRQALAELIVRDGDELAAALSLGVPLAGVDGDADAFAADLPADADLLAAITATRRPG